MTKTSMLLLRQLVGHLSRWQWCLLFK